MTSAPSSSRFTGTMPAVWLTSRTRWMPRSRQALPTVATSCTVPMTLEPWFITTALVFFLKRRMMSWGSTQPMTSKSTQSTSTPSCSSFQSGRRVAL